jgi:hypothetical protein
LSNSSRASRAETFSTVTKSCHQDLCIKALARVRMAS